MCKKFIKWGIIGCGKIAGQFAESLKVVKDAGLFAVASRSEEKARDFGIKHGAVKWYNSYELLAKDDEIDVVYIATPHNVHYETSMLCIQNKKAVLCEKPLTINSKEAINLIQAARDHKTFLMEALWTRFLPSTLKLRALLDEGIIGKCKLLQADFGYNMPYNPENRSYNPDLAGGALLDVGIYPINFAQMIFKDYPTEIKSSIIQSPTGVDEQSAYIFKYPSGALAVMNAAVSVETRHNAWIYGSEGYIHMPEFFHATHIHVHRMDGYNETFSVPFNSTGYGYEAVEVMSCICTQQLESKIMPLAETLDIIRMMDTIREQWGLIYPGELPDPEQHE
jgi:predicted dehydrogenase